MPAALSKLRKSDLQPDRVDKRDLYHMVPKLQMATLTGFFLVVAYSLQFHPIRDTLSVSATGIMVGGAATLLGFLTGFIFCIPRAAKNTQRAVAAAIQTDTSATAGSPRSSFEDNSNLVDISDWLTKILVGAGLVELNKIPHALWSLCGYLSPGLRACDSSSCVAESQTFVLAILLFFFPAGFLIGYLWTRLYYQKALAELVVENATLSEESIAREHTYDALTFMNLGKLDSALESIDQALSLEPGNGRAAFEKARILKQLAEKNQPPDQKLLREALAYATQASQLLPDNSSALYNLACYQNLLGYDSAIVLSNLKRALDKKPDLKTAADEDPDLKSLQQLPEYKGL